MMPAGAAEEEKMGVSCKERDGQSRPGRNEWMFCQRTEKGSCGEGKGKWCVDGGEHKGKERRERFGGARP